MEQQLKSRILLNLQFAIESFFRESYDESERDIERALYSLKQLKYINKRNV